MARYFVENEDDIMKVSDTDRLVTKGGVTHWDSGEKVAYVHFSYSRDIKIWQLDSDQFKAFSKYQLKDVDPSMDYTLTREGYITAMSLNGMAYERWGADQEKIITANPKRYERVTSLHYSAALDALVERYGIEEFMNSAKWVIRSHLYGLHFPTHIANAWGDTHTDISGFREPTSALASAAVRKKHPVVADFGESGRVGLGVYNAKPLFADLDFWNYMTVDHPDSAYELIQYFFSLGEISQGQHYDNYSFIPKEMLVVSFPEVTKLLESFLGTFSSTKLEH